MPVYVFKAIDEKENVIQGTLQAPSVEVAQVRLARAYKNVMTLTEQSESPQRAAPLMQMTPRIKYENLSVYTRQLATMINAGIAINRALRFCAQGEDQNLNLVMNRAADAIEEGKSFSRALEDQPRAFGNIYIAMVKAGETSGNLDVCLNKLSELLEKTVKMRKRVASTFAYPGVIAVVATGIVALFVFYIMPMMLPMFTSMGVTLPWPTKMLILITETASDPRFMVPFGLAAAVAAWLAFTFFQNLDSAPNVRYQLDQYVLRIPVVGPLLRRNAEARVLYTIATLLDAGVQLSEVLSTVERVAGNMVLSRRIGWARKALLEGASVFRSFEMHEVFESTALQMMKVGEETGTLGDMARRIGKLYEDDVDIQLDNLASMLEPAIMAIMGVVVGFVTLAAFLPMVNLLREL